MSYTDVNAVCITGIGGITDRDNMIADFLWCQEGNEAGNNAASLTDNMDNHGVCVVWCRCNVAGHRAINARD